jgi:DNA-binding NarL/FixJ family response regulator
MNPSDTTQLPAKPVAPLLHKIAVVEDLREIRESLSQLIGTLADFKCVCACASGEDALKQIPPARPDVVFMDIFLPGMSDIECITRLKVLLPDVRILILTASDDEEMVFPALEAGADGYLLKQAEPADLRAALLDLLQGGVPMTSGIARRVVDYFRHRAKSRDQIVHLPPPRERAFDPAFQRLFQQGNRRQTLSQR